MDCARNIITAAFPAGKTETTTAPLWQWDYGQVLCITGIDLPAAFEVHFSTNRTGGVSTTAVGADGQVTIPNVLLTIGKNLNAWIYLSDAQGEGETEYSITIPVKPRPMPETYDAEVTGEFDDVVRQVGEYAETAQTAADNAGASATAAAASASEAAASASAAETAKTAAETAQGDAEDAQAAAETAAQTATEKAQQTAQDAAQAAQSKADAESAAGRAEAAQTGAESAKADAETAAQGAADSASAASASATGAGQAASAAAQSASAAAESATTAGNAAQTATTKAAEAFASADAAAASETAAQTAQTAAETAATNAGQSASTATTKAAEAAQSASNAAASETAAEAAATRAETAAASIVVDDALSDTSTNPVQNKVITGEVTQVKNAIEFIGDDFDFSRGVNLIDVSKLIIGHDLVNQTGGMGANANWYVTDWIEVEPNTKYTISGTSSLYRAEVGADKSSYTGLGKNVATFTTGANTKYVRFNSLINGYSTPQLQLGDTATPYEPYVKVSKWKEEIEKNIVDVQNEISNIENLDFDFDVDFAQYGGEKRIWFSTTDFDATFSEGDVVESLNADYQVCWGTYTGVTRSPQTAWATKSTATDSIHTYVALRKTDSSDISGLTAEYVKSIIRVTKSNALSQALANISPTKFAHISIDDCTFWADLIANANVYSSAFENAKLAHLKKLHESYGAVFTLNCFTESDDDSIADVPSKFAGEFRANKDWLRFSFHGTDVDTLFSIDMVDEIKGYYNTFVSSIYTMTGDYECIDRVARLSSFTGTLNNVKALRDCNAGIKGLLTKDTPVDGSSYYLTEDQYTYINTHCKLYDADNYITFIRSMLRLPTADNPSVLDNASYANYSPMVELFWHETDNFTSDYWTSTYIIPWLNYLNNNGYTFAFAENALNL